VIQLAAFLLLVAALASLLCGHHDQPLPQRAARGLWRAIRRPTGPRTTRTSHNAAQRRTRPTWAQPEQDQP